MSVNDVKEHIHIDKDGHIYTHVHKDDKSHTHKHIHENTKAIVNRLSRAIGHLESVKRMVENDRECIDILIQLAAVTSALNNAGKLILQEHIENCIVVAVESGDKKVINMTFNGDTEVQTTDYGTRKLKELGTEINAF
jgi:DNA-binding FrmR family transcriptional regulator